MGKQKKPKETKWLQRQDSRSGAPPVDRAVQSNLCFFERLEAGFSLVLFHILVLYGIAVHFELLNVGSLRPFAG